jgi:hypothetical protein
MPTANKGKRTGGERRRLLRILRESAGVRFEPQEAYMIIGRNRFSATSSWLELSGKEKAGKRMEQQTSPPHMERFVGLGAVG